MLRFKSRVAPIVLIIIIIPFIVMAIASIWAENTSERILLLLIATFILILLLLLILGIEYQFHEDEVHLKMFFFKKRIKYKDVSMLKVGNNLTFIGLKISAAWKNTIVLKYNTHDEVLISPADVEGFVDEMRKHVKELEVERN